MRTTQRAASRVKGWGKVAPRTTNERRALLARCGRAAFLDPDGLRFPVMPKAGGCVVDCRGARVAYSRARQYGHRAVAARAKRIGERGACAWAR